MRGSVVLLGSFAYSLLRMNEQSNQCEINWLMRLVSRTKGQISTKNAIAESSFLFKL